MLISVSRFALMSIIMGFAFNTSFRSSTPAPTPTVNGPPSSNAHVWSLFAPQPNRSILTPSTALQKSGVSGSSPSLKDMALSVFNPGSTSLSMTAPASSKSLSLPSSSSNSVVEMTTTSPIAKCQECISKAGPSTEKSTDVVLRSMMPTSLSARPSGSVIASLSGSASTIILTGADRAAGIPKSTAATVASAVASLKLNSVTEVLDATTKALAEAVGSDLAELVEAADDLLVNLREQTDNVIRQSKGKARAFGEQIQNLNEEMVSRNKRAKKRAQELKKKGEELVRGARKEFSERTTKAKKRARALKKSVVDGGTEAWKTYEKTQGTWEAVLSDKKPRMRREDKQNEHKQAQSYQKEKKSKVPCSRARRTERKAKKDKKNIYA